MKIFLKIVAIFLIVFGVIFLFAGIIGIVDNPDDIAISIIALVFVGIIPIFIGILIMKKQKNKNQSNTPIKENITREKKQYSGFSLFTNYSKLLNVVIGNKENWKEIFEEHQKSKDAYNEKKLYKFGILFFNNILKEYLSDLFISNDELKSLNEIKSYFNLSDNEINTIKKKYAKNTIKELTAIKLSDKILSDDDKSELYNLANVLNFSIQEVDVIINNNAIKIFNQAKQQVMGDRRVSPDEENELKTLAKNLGLSDGDINEILNENDKANLAYYKLLYEVENGNLPEIHSPVPLTKGEICHLAIDASRIELKTVTKGYSGGSRGFSVRIMKGVNYRVGNFRGQPIKEQVKIKYPGQLVLTSKKVVFTAFQKGTSIPLNKISHIEPYSNGVGIQKESTNYLFDIQKGAELVGLMIANAVNKL